ACCRESRRWIESGFVRGCLSAILAVWLAGEADAACVCRCVDGEQQALCTSSTDLPPICPVTSCPMPPLSIEPIQRPVLPPLGTSDCSQRQVQDPATNRYEWREVCD